MRKLALAAAAAAILGLFAGGAMAGTPSTKEAAAIGALVPLIATAELNGANPATDDTGWVTVLKAIIKTPNQKELAFDVALQTGIITFTEVKSKGGNKETSKARGSMHVRVKVTGPSGVRFAEPLGDSTGVFASTGMFNPIDDFSGPVGVTYQARLQVLSAEFNGLNCVTVGDDPPFTIVCADPEVISLLQETLSANAFNFVLLNTEPGVHNIEVQARATADAAIFCATAPCDTTNAKGEAFAGLGSMLVEQIRLINGDADFDGVADDTDTCPLLAGPQLDTDSDGQGNICDLDDDNDGLLDVVDATPLVFSDADSDGIGDGFDNCPFVANADQLDADGDGVGAVCDADDSDSSVQ